MRPAGNAILATAEDARPLRFRADTSTVVLVDGVQGIWDPADESLDYAKRLLAAFLTANDVEDAFTALGFRLDETVLGMELFEDEEAGEIAVQRIGGSHAWLRLEPGIARPRSFTIVSGNLTFEVRATAYGDAGNGWFPTEAEVTVDGRRVLGLSVTDLAASTGDLAPLDPDFSTQTTVIALPRLPL